MHNEQVMINSIFCKSFGIRIFIGSKFVPITLVMAMAYWQAIRFIISLTYALSTLHAFTLGSPKKRKGRMKHKDGYSLKVLLIPKDRSDSEAIC